MKQLKFYKYATWLLLCLNLLLVIWFLFTSPPHRGHLDGKQTAMEILNLSKDQNKTFLNLAKKHMEQTSEMNDDQRKLLELYFKGLFTKDSTSTSVTIMNKVKVIEEMKIEATYQHFKKIKSILNPEQLVDFEIFVKNALQRILQKNKKGTLHPKE